MGRESCWWSNTGRCNSIIMTLRLCKICGLVLSEHSIEDITKCYYTIELAEDIEDAE
jgi:hypothetical protein